ncbi:anthranilate synthase component I [Candidatus Uhrbacteria bacterium CG10_big_fil_rev_8_21_14_0_10_48_11]|uniref:Anthranilate synthase component 1 n=1 Tax=Candidatus Uhrbacteria bacterium CG10_big_fil_rev_8_21_14_0_10_48_11 TaxID=1975037 RepID=A0A2M8LDN4_9BACT|nr:MAG: anthranilate synthase component I [Candidatus Uhrbacteria bacterium CG10_big_fil_rev_8_21_14_0_10_48_11]
MRKVIEAIRSLVRGQSLDVREYLMRAYKFIDDSFETFMSLHERVGEGGTRCLVPVVIGLASDTVTPVSVYHSVQMAGGGPTALLESVPQGQHLGEFTIIGIRASARFTVEGDRSVLKPRLGRVEIVDGMPLAHLESFLKRVTPMARPLVAPFLGGAIGYVGFEGVCLVEPSISRHQVNDLQWPEIDLVAFDELIIFDHVKRAVYLVALAETGKEGKELAKQTYADAYWRAHALVRHLFPQLELLGLVSGVGETVSTNMTKCAYKHMVEEGQRYITSGDVFQVVLSQRFSTSFSGNTLDFYRHLRRVNPSPCMFHLDLGDGRVVVGASPEVMVKVDGSDVHVRPIAGTRRRSSDPVEDERLRRELASDEKEKAEHRMLVDLARNDVGRVAEAGTVRVGGVMRVESYSTVHHLVSDVSGRLSSDVSPIRAFLTCLPAGTLSGAPKIRACQIIRELEPCVRGPYGGAVGWFTSRGLDTGIAIRTAWIEKGVMYWQAGGGVVADSTPTGEYEESLTKAKSIGSALNVATGRSNP